MCVAVARRVGVAAVAASVKVKQFLLSRAAAFAPPSSSGVQCYAASRLSSTENSDDEVAVVDRIETESDEDSLAVPLTYNEMVSQVADTMAMASEEGFKRQIVRILLPRDASSGKLGEMYEPQAETSTRAKAQEMKLVPTDESWQGGIMQLLRACTPTLTDIMTELSPTYRTTGVPPSILEDRSIDESGVDGVSILYTSMGSGANTKQSSDGGGFFGGFLGDFSPPSLSDDDVCVFVQPTQEIIESVSSISSTSNDALIALVNPQWRNVDDALDLASSQDNIFGAFASFLGGKGNVLRQLDELDFKATYTLEGYVCKGGNVRLLKKFNSDWYVFAESDGGDQFVTLGSMPERPTYQDVQKMLDEKGVGYKYARDLGMAPPLK
ncbi:hypothetical protein THAOC_01193 [Thalassiosira oceanica]|uniref:DUF1995 domain-containing protein n=1 Tax=Thalassiosira oceanica TaxID=159749 RepID=K0THP6_THAOC|nr:hypothetical protein THAOC_01193 [Thalassiosira oceanica]|eukprot:EJK77005.1 hypothetical protein THAOC_01193 [Thalassiosira oceanica]